MSYVALYRKYRPKTFDEVIGQDHITKTLINQIMTDQVGHAYLFCGSRGTGKTSTAKIFARAINCLTPVNGSACGKCDVCKTDMEQSLDIVEIDAASNNGVDEIRNLREQVKYSPVVGKYKVYIIDEVHMLSIAAFNALLKTLEEPPKHVVFVLATTEIHKLPATILSRCMRFDFKLVSIECLTKLIEKILNENKIKFEAQAVEQIARAGEGSVRDTLSILDRVLSYSGNNLKYDDVVQILGSVEKGRLVSIAQALLSDNMGQMLLSLDEILKEGKSPLVLSKELTAYFRDLMLILTLQNDAKKMVLVPSDVYEKMSAQAVSENYAKIVRAIDKLSEVEQELRFSVKPRIVIETCLIRAMHNNALENRITELEKKLEGLSLEDKKKITKVSGAVASATAVQVPTEKTRTLSREERLMGSMLKNFRQNSNMLAYSLLTRVEDFEIVGNKFVLRTDDRGIFEQLTDKKNRETIESFLRSVNFECVIEQKENKMETLKNKLIKEFGSKLKIVE